MQETLQYIQDNKERFVQELFELLRIPSISADSAYKNDVLKCADWVADSLKKAGADNVEVCQTKGNPIVYGDKIIDKNLPTVLVYGHYDVQPPDPLELWTKPPFEPYIEKTALHPEGAIFARGSADDKGQFFMHLKAFEAMMHTNALPCNVKFILEGEEEVGSESLGDFVNEYKEKLACDCILISDTHIYSNEQPTVTTGLRGLSYVEVEVEGPNRDLHSGLYGGAVPNPIHVLSRMIAKLIDDDGR
ncbi:MAG: M20/M25/M40 family metallo-hydrolase, partial [Bacteroidetes bacterium]|nr:M20/M25/M40 family metallo-hydrolase [Bacteroidota bacterium]